MSVVVTGVTELDAALTALPNALQKKGVRVATRESAKLVLRDARRAAPVQTGALRRSLTVRTARSGFRGRKLPRGTLGHEVTTKEGNLFKGDSFYGGILEFGSKHIESRRYLRDAIHKNKQAVVGVFRGTLAQALPRIVADAKRATIVAAAKQDANDMYMRTLLPSAPRSSIE